jgi:hypothetical protein
VAITSGQISRWSNKTTSGQFKHQSIQTDIHNNEGTTTLYVGNADVTVDNGLRLEAKDSLEIQMNAGESFLLSALQIITMFLG